MGDNRHVLKCPNRPRALHLCIGPRTSLCCQRFFTRKRSCCLHANSSAITFAQYVMTVTVVPTGFGKNHAQSNWAGSGQKHGSEMIQGDCDEKDSPNSHPGLSVDHWHGTDQRICVWSSAAFDGPLLHRQGGHSAFCSHSPF